MDDAGLIAGYVAGEPECHRQVDRWIDEVLRRRALGLGEDREDVAQESRRRLLMALRDGRFEGRCSLRTYVWRLAQSAAIDQLRARARRGKPASLDDVPEPLASGHPGEGLEHEERRRLFGRVLEEMGVDCRPLWAMAIFMIAFTVVLWRVRTKKPTTFAPQAALPLADDDGGRHDHR